MAESILLEIEGIGFLEDVKVMRFSESEGQNLPKHGVEEGEPIGDHSEPDVHQIDIEISISGMGKPNPFHGYSLEQLRAAVQAMPDYPQKNPYEERFKQIWEAKRKGKRVRLHSERGTYDNLLIGDIQSPIEKNMGLGAVLAIKLERVPVATTETAIVPEVKMGKGALQQFGTDIPTRHGPKGNGGRVFPTQADVKADLQLLSLLGKWSGI